MGAGSKRSARPGGRSLVAIVLSAMLLAAVPAGAVPGVPPDITAIAESDQDIDPGETRTYRVLVTGFDSGGTWTFSGTGLTATVIKSRSGAVQLSVAAAESAEAGVRSLTATNPDGLADTFADAITVTGTTPPATGDLTGLVFEDVDGDGVLDAGESGLAGVAVVATAADDVQFAAMTDAGGEFALSGLAIGDATVVYDTPQGFTSTTGNSSQTVAIVEDAATSAQDVGFVAVLTGGVAGHVFSDADGDGMEDGSDSGLAGVAVSVTDAAGAAASTTTDASGDFAFAGLGVGDAQLTFTAPPGFSLTTNNDAQTVAITAETTAATDAVGYLPPEISDSPNFVVVVTDDQRWDSIGRCVPVVDGFDFDAGSDACMPHLQDMLMDAGTTFLKGEVTQSLCCPSRASIFTGQYSTTHGVTNLVGADLDDSSTIATWLDDVGYRTGLFGKYLNGYGTGSLENYIPPGWDSFHSFHGAGGGKGVYDNYPWIHWDEGDPAPVITAYNDADSVSGESCAEGNFYSTDFMCRLALDFLTADAQTPFFLYVGTAAPHTPRIAAARHVGVFSNLVPALYPDYDQIPSPNPPAYLPTTPLRGGHFGFITKQTKDAMESTLAVDDLIGELHAQLAADGRLASTVWVFISDNGYAFGEHRLGAKECEYLVCHRVPFVVVCPAGICAGATPGSVDGDHYALNIDIAPTIADLAGATPTLAVDGRSLVPILMDTSAVWRTEWFLHEGTPTLDGIVAEASDGHTYKYVEFSVTGETELYDLDVDPWELANLAGDPAHAAIEDELSARLAEHLAG